MSTVPTKNSYPKLVGSLKCWIVLWHHEYGVDAWPIYSIEEPTEEQAIESLIDSEFDPDNEWIEFSGPYDLPQ